uniref:Calmodulin binding transcription activator 1 n=1 Tax=Eptatretus burgeri TaxID=7764 RepID=A0A8C4X1X9_EPTBU
MAVFWMIKNLDCLFCLPDNNNNHVTVFLPKKLLECLPKCSTLPKERHRWNTNEVGAISNTQRQGDDLGLFCWIQSRRLAQSGWHPEPKWLPQHFAAPCNTLWSMPSWSEVHPTAR